MADVPDNPMGLMGFVNLAHGVGFVICPGAIRLAIPVSSGSTTSNCSVVSMTAPFVVGVILGDRRPRCIRESSQSPGVRIEGNPSGPSRGRSAARTGDPELHGVDARGRP